MIKVEQSYGRRKGGYTIAKDPLLPLDNSTLIYILGSGDYRFINIEFEEARAITEMEGTPDIIGVFANPELEHIMLEYLDIEKQGFAYTPAKEMHAGQDATTLRLYITPSGTQPTVLGEDGQQARKIRNLRICCQHAVRLK